MYVKIKKGKNELSETRENLRLMCKSLKKKNRLKLHQKCVCEEGVFSPTRTPPPCDCNQRTKTEKMQ